MSTMPRYSLEQDIREEIKARGPITFARFMERALYDPVGGYYQQARDPIGRGGDYVTSPEIHGLFGRLLGRQMEAMLSAVPPCPELTLVEMGAGRGSLMRDVLLEIRQKNPGLFDRLRCVINERSPAMADRQRTVLAESGLGAKIEWSGGLRDPARRERITGCLFSNELVDAFPVHRVAMTEEGLKEIFVCLKDNRLAETVDEPSDPEIAAYFDRIGIGLVPGQAAEVNLAAVRWMKEVGAILDRGFVLTVDYGHTAADLYSDRRRKGTLLCYSRHAVSEDPFREIGGRDMTAHVDFTTLARVGREAGLEVTGFTDQAHFLMSLGATEEMEGMDPESGGFQAMRRLIADTQMGRTFKILIQHKGLSPPALQGLTYRPFFDDALFR